jgi:hypothetical protein
MAQLPIVTSSGKEWGSLMQGELEKAMRDRYMIDSNPWATGPGHTHNHSPYAAYMQPRTVTSPNSHELKGMIASRLRTPNLNDMFSFIEVHKHVDDRISVFLVVNDQAVTIEDEFNLFPSDKLITQLRLLDKGSK